MGLAGIAALAAIQLILPFCVQYCDSYFKYQLGTAQSHLERESQSRIIQIRLIYRHVWFGRLIVIGDRKIHSEYGWHHSLGRMPACVRMKKASQAQAASMQRCIYCLSAFGCGCDMTSLSSLKSWTVTQNCKPNKCLPPLHHFRSGYLSHQQK